MKYIDIETWKRREHFRFFHRMDYPQYNICMDIDVTNFLEFVKTKNLSFYYAMIYAVTKSVNETEAFRYRIREDGVVLHDIIHPSFTDAGLDPEGELFRMVVVDFTDDMELFDERAKKESDNQQAFILPEKLAGRDDLIYITSIPWISFTHISHTISLNRDDSVPRISWGKYFRREDKVLLPFSVQVNHALVDGLHVGRYVERLQHLLNGFQV